MYSRFIIKNGRVEKLAPKNVYDRSPTLVRGYDRDGYKIIISFEHTMAEVIGVMDAYVSNHPHHDIKMDSDSQAFIDKSVRLQ